MPKALGSDRLQQLALRYLTGRERTHAQLTAYLLRKGASPNQLRPLLHRFQALGYLDDDRYAWQWAAARLRATPMGRARLELELRRRGIAVAVARRTLERLYAEQDESDLARRLLTRRRSGRRTSPNTTPEQRRRRQLLQSMALLQRYGFRADVIRGIVSEWRREQDEDQRDSL